jgi:periplasmic divalent cation tolerance protein
MTEPAYMVCSTCPDERSAAALAELLVNRHLAACVNVIPGVRSTYRWQGKCQTDDEHLLLVKTTPRRFAEVEQAIREQHPYELPEVVALPIVEGASAYLSWINQCVRSDEP